MPNAPADRGFGADLALSAGDHIAAGTLVSESVEIRPGLTPIADWRAVYRGASLALDPVARCDVEAGRAALSDILSSGETSDDVADASPSVADLIQKHGEPLPNGLLRLFVALKLASLAQGASGVRWHVIKAIAAFLSRDLLPVVSAEGVSDRLALARLFGALTGAGEVLSGGRVRSAQKALKKEKLVALKLSPLERAALLSGTQLSIAVALAGLFEAERVFQSAVVTAALTMAGHPEARLHPTAHRLHRQRGQMEVAAAFSQLLDRGGARAAAAAARGADDSTSRLYPIRLGVPLDLLRHAGAMLERAARGVSEDRLVLWQSDEIVAGTDDLSSVAVASDLIALALRTIGDLSQARIAVTAALRETSGPAANENTGGLEARAGAFAAENRERGQSTALDPGGVWRLLPMAGTTALVVAIECLQATRAAETLEDRLPEPLAAVLKSVREVAHPGSEIGAGAASNLASVGAMVGSGALAAAAGIQLPSLSPPSVERPEARLGGRTKRT